MTDLLAQLAALAEKATPGPWLTADLDQGMQIWSSVHQYIGATRDYTGNDAALIVLLRNSLPAILAMGRREAALREAAAEYMSQFGQALEANGIPYGPAQIAAHNKAIAALEGEQP